MVALSDSVLVNTLDLKGLLITAFLFSAFER